MQKTWVISIILFVVLILVSILESNAPKPINWNESFHYKDKNPYGSYVLYERLADIFPKQSIELNKLSLYECAEKWTNDYRQEDSIDSTLKGNLIVIHKQLILEKSDTEAIMRLVGGGMYAFLSAEEFSTQLSDTLDFKLNEGFSLHTSNKDSISLFFTYNAGHKFFYKKNTADMYFKQYPAEATVLAKNSNNYPVLLHIPFKKGFFILSSTPLAFTNYNMLDSQNIAWVEQALSLLPNQKTYWDEYQRIEHTDDDKGGIFRYILQEPPLRWAFYITLFAFLLFVFFEAKRKQRIIPVIEPLKNTSLEFISIIGRLYYLYKDHQNIANKKINYFLEQIRSNFYIKTNQIDDEFFETLSAKSGVSMQELKNIFRQIEWIQNQNAIAEADLLKLNDLIESFNQQAIA